MPNEISVYKINKLLWRWTKQDDARAVRGVGMSLDKPPPAQLNPPKAHVEQAEPKSRPPAPAQRGNLPDDNGKNAQALSRSKTQLSKPEVPRSPEPPRLTKRATTVPPFDIQDIPAAMRKEMMPVGAKLMDRWFAGELNYSRSEDDQKNEINQDGKPYPDSMYDHGIIKMKWVLGFRRAREQYEDLVNERIYSSKAASAVRQIVARYTAFGRMYLSAWGICRHDIRILHKDFQFQYVTVDGTFEQKAKTALRQSTAHAPDDLTAALGSFVINAAISEIEYDFQKRIGVIEKIVVYVKDSYSFQGELDTTSQYLGHWSRRGVAISAATELANLAGSPWIDFPVVIGPTQALSNPGKVYYPIRNRDFRQWQRKHNRGGDFIVYSDFNTIRLQRPIVVHF
ncbi:hypothetical protein OKW40_006875 [Paraburkholderia sp. RAU6.4a]